jgi:hypothetical protein
LAQNTALGRDDRGAALLQARQRGAHADHRRDQHDVHPVLLEHVQVAVLLARMVVAVAEDDRQAGLVRLVLDPPRHVGEDRFATSSTTRPIVRLRLARSWRADSFLTKPSSMIAASTRSRVGAATISGRLMTLGTVAPACAATSLMLTRSPAFLVD